MVERDPGHRGPRIALNRGTRASDAWGVFTSGSRLVALSLAGALAVMAGASSTPEAGASIDGRLLIASTPDDPFFGGRQLDLPLTLAGANDGETLALAYRRVINDFELFDDPAWGIRSQNLDEIEAGAEYPLDGDVILLHDNFRLIDDRCPDLTGSTTVHEFDRDESGVVTALSMTFVAHCRPSDTAYGSLSFGADVLPLPAEAEPILARETRFPSLSSEYDDEGSANLLAVDIRPRRLWLRWDTPSGFDCAAVQARQIDGTLVFDYLGRDDTGLIADPDQSRQLLVAPEFSASRFEGACPSEPSSGYGSLRIHPLQLTVRVPRFADATGLVTLRGSVKVTAGPDYSDPAPFVEVTFKGRTRDGDVRRLGSATTGVDGHYDVELDPRRCVRVWAVVVGGAEPTSGGANAPFWYHWRARTEAQGVRPA